MRIHRSRGIALRKGLVATRQLPSAPEMDRTDFPGDNGLARQRGPVGNSEGNEEWSNDLFGIMIRKQLTKIQIYWKVQTART